MDDGALTRWEIDKKSKKKQAIGELSEAWAKKPDSSHQQSPKSKNFTDKLGNYTPSPSQELKF